ncbi:hypothetical protein T439DRAFT_349862 [Meredithblackwellia eburnea MCA 4105]
MSVDTKSSHDPPPSKQQQQHKIPIKDRPKPSSRDKARLIAFFAIFFSSCVFGLLFQLLVALPFRLVPLQQSHKIYRQLVATSKAFFGAVLVAITNSHSGFGKTQLVLTADDSINLNNILEWDDNGQVVGIKLAKQSIWIANHQAYCDWIFLWILFVLGKIDTGLIIILKASLKWVPILGPAMQFYRFIFIDKTRTLQKSSLNDTAKQALRDDSPFALLLFPEGTLVSRLTRPKSQAFAQAQGVPDPRNLLLPRSAGLLYCLRSLIPQFKSSSSSLALYDITIGYPGVNPQGYAQDYYTLQTIYGRGVAPPQVHLHLRQVDLSTVPGIQTPPTSSSSSSSITSGPGEEGGGRVTTESTTTEADLSKFQEWTRKRWEDKDMLLDEFYDKGKFPEGNQGSVTVKIPLKLLLGGRGAEGWWKVPVGVVGAAKLVGKLWALVRR